MPTWNIIVDLAITGVVNFHFDGRVFGGISSTVSISAPAPVDADAFAIGLDTSSTIALAAVAVEAALGGPLDPGAVMAGGVTIMAGMIVATEAAIGYGTADKIHSYLYGLFAAPALALPCYIQQTTGLPLCPELPVPSLVDLSYGVGTWYPYLTMLYGSWISGVEAGAVAWAVAAMAIGFAFAGLFLALI